MARSVESNRPRTEFKYSAIKTPSIKRMRGPGNSPGPRSRGLLLAARRTLDHAEHADTDSQQGNHQHQSEQRVRRHERPDGTHQGSSGTRLRQYLFQTSSSCESFLLPNKVMDAGDGFEPSLPPHKSGMLPLHHPARLILTFRKPLLLQLLNTLYKSINAVLLLLHLEPSKM